MNRVYPPRWAETILRSALHTRDRDIITGDLIEEYRETIVPDRGIFRARLWYVWQTATLIAFARRPDMNKQVSWLWLAVGAASVALIVAVLARNGFAPPALPWAAIAIPLVLIATAVTSIRSVADLIGLCKLAWAWTMLLILAIGVHALIPFDVERYFLAQARAGFSELEFPARFAFGVSIALILIGAGFDATFKTSLVRRGILAAVAAAVPVVLPFYLIGDRSPQLLALAAMLGSVLGAIGGMLGKGIRGLSPRTVAVALSMLTVGLMGCGHASAVSHETTKALAAMQFDAEAPVTVDGIVTLLDFPVDGEGMILVKTSNAGYAFLTSQTGKLAKGGFTRFNLHPGERVTVTGLLARGNREIEGVIAAQAARIQTSDGRILFDRSALR